MFYGSVFARNGGEPTFVMMTTPRGETLTFFWGRKNSRPRSFRIGESEFRESTAFLSSLRPIACAGRG